MLLLDGLQHSKRDYQVLQVPPVRMVHQDPLE